MDTRRLAQYCAIVECGSLTSAAELLSVSHSGLSKAMALLQQELGVSLFRPRGRGLEVTDQGRAVYLKSKTILAQVDALRVPDAPAQSAARVAMPEVC